jgi:hypothetical protein
VETKRLHAVHALTSPLHRRRAQTEILDIFGDGGDYEDALDFEEETLTRPAEGETKYADVSAATRYHWANFDCS